MPLGQSPLSGLPISGNPPPPPEELAAPPSVITDDAIVLAFTSGEDFAGAHPSEEIAPPTAAPVGELQVVVPSPGEDFAGSLALDEQAASTAWIPIDPPVRQTSSGEDFAGAQPLDEHGLPPWTPRESTWIAAPPIAEDFSGAHALEELAAPRWTPREPVWFASPSIAEELPPQPVPPTPQPRTRGSGVEYAERKWQERWDEIAQEHKVVEETGKAPWEPPPIVEDQSVVVLGPGGAVDKGIESEADYTILPVGDGAAVRAMASGWVQYTYRDRLGLCAALAGDDGVRYLYVGLGRPEGEPRHVGKGEVIGFTLTAAEREASTATHAELTEGSLVAEHPELTMWTFDVTVGGAPPPTWPRQAEVLMLGLPLAGVVLALGAPVVGAAIGTATLIIAARRPK